MTLTQTSRTAPTPLAIIGMGCRFPGADNIEQFWDMLVAGRSALGPLPADRFDREISYSPDRGQFGKTYCDLGGVVSPQPFDTGAMPFDAALASRYDVSHLTLCEVVAAACRDAGYDPRAIPVRKTGVYVGNSSGGSELDCRTAYHRHAPAMAALLEQTPGFDQLSQETRAAVTADVIQSIRRDYPERHSLNLVGLSPHVAATMLVELLGLQGPALVADAACASSFVALNMAAQALANGEIDMAIVASAAQRKLYEWVAIAQAGSMTETGCYPFDAAADGIICSDGYGAILVKRLDQALVDGDEIRGVIRGIGMASDGRGKGFWAPLAAGQAKAIRRAYEAGVDPAGLQYIEAHATSTQLGDKTEIESLTLALGDSLSSKIPVASVKGNIGHTLEAAGMAGLIKTLLGMEHGIIPPAPNLQTPNPNIPWEDVPFYVPDRALVWSPADGNYIRRAGVNSFGIGGLNLHLVVDQSPESLPSGVLPPAGLLAPAIQHREPDQLPKGKPGVSKMPGLCTEPIAIVGVSCLLPGAHSPDELWQMLEEGRDVRRSIPGDRWDPHTLCVETTPTNFRGGFIDDYEFDWKTFRIPPKQLEAANPLQFLILDAAARALADAGTDDKPLNHDRVSAIVGTNLRSDYIIDNWYGVWMPEFTRRLTQALNNQQVPSETVVQIAAAYEKVLAAEKPAARDETGSLSSSTLAARITKHFDFHGGAYTVDAADMSGAAALSSAIDLLNSGDSDTVICAAGQRCMDVTFFEEQNDAQALETTPAEGVVCFVLKRLAVAEQQGDRVRGILHASTVVGNASSERAAQVAVDRAFATSQVDPDQVGLRESPGVAAHCETETLDSFSSRPTNVELNSLSQHIGNLQGGSVLLSLLHALLVLEHGRTPSAAGGQPIYAGTGTGSGLASLGQISQRGFSQESGGMACHLLLEAGGDLPTRPDAAPSEGTHGAEEAIVEFDATAVRKQRMREQALARRKPTHPSE